MREKLKVQKCTTIFKHLLYHCALLTVCLFYLPYMVSTSCPHSLTVFVFLCHRNYGYNPNKHASSPHFFHTRISEHIRPCCKINNKMKVRADTLSDCFLGVL